MGKFKIYFRKAFENASVMKIFVMKSRFTFVLPYLGKSSLDLRTSLQQTLEGKLPYFNF